MKTVLMILCKGFEEIEASAFSDIMGWSREHGTMPVALVTAGLHHEIASVWGTVVKPKTRLQDIDPADYDALALPGGFESAGFYEDAFDERVLEVIRYFDQYKKPVASICVGALPLGKSGILNQRPATTYALPHGERQAQLSAFGALVQNTPVVKHGHIVTSTGPSTAMDVAFTLLEMLTDANNVAAVKKYMGFS